MDKFKSGAQMELWKSIETNSGRMYGFALLPKGDFTSTSHTEGDKSIKIWSKYGDLKVTFGLKNSVLAICRLPNGDLAIASQDNTIQILDSETGDVKRTLSGHSKAIWGLTLLPNGELGSSSADYTLKIWSQK